MQRNQQLWVITHKDHYASFRYMLITAYGIMIPKLSSLTSDCSGQHRNISFSSLCCFPRDTTRSCHCSSLCWTTSNSCSLPSGVCRYCKAGMPSGKVCFRVPRTLRKICTDIKIRLAHPNNHTASLLFHIIPRPVSTSSSPRLVWISSSSRLVSTSFSIIIFSHHSRTFITTTSHRCWSHLLCRNILRRSSMSSSIRRMSSPDLVCSDTFLSSFRWPLPHPDCCDPSRASSSSHSYTLTISCSLDVLPFTKSFNNPFRSTSPASLASESATSCCLLLSDRITPVLIWKIMLLRYQNIAIANILN